MENIKSILFHLIQMMQPSNNSQILKLVEGITTTLGWSIKTISHMALEELFIRVMNGSMMDNSKMECFMDILDILVMMETVMNMNFKMVSE